MDHHLTYKDKNLKNLPHRLRLKAIINVLDQMKLGGGRYCDVGCSNGYLINLICERFRISDATGLDHHIKNITLAKERYPNINFQFVDLNVVNNSEDKYSIITCFETLEHAGNLENALENLINLSGSRGMILITVPIEVGAIGLAKFLVKTLVYLYQYKLTELNKSDDKYFYLKYLFSLLVNESVAKYRNKCSGYGTHFGFDYRVMNNWLQDRGVNYSIQKKGTTAFFTIQC